MIFGTMKWFSADRGFGLITRDDGGTEDPRPRTGNAALR
ncbi:cold shock domain-containing protein [Actinoplanes hulinensis]|uniref:Cold shock domain-containing protein n=1 Tax=Actinoplanes hulinensis TaxID=1144547 RepID=A0ABS7B5W3_9ACTN|nr:cold shock domain-containing protein [Actinoplanes hulinensis]